MDSEQYDVTVAGHVCLDIIPEIYGPDVLEIDDFFEPGKLIQVGAAHISAGGPVANTGLALAKLGFNVAYMARIGDDPFGRLILDALAGNGYIDGISQSIQDRTSYSVAIVPPGIDRFFLHFPGANDHFSSSDLDENLITRSKIFHFGYPPLMARCYQDNGEALVNILRIAKSAGTTISLDMALPDPNSPSGKAPWKDILRNILPYVDLFIPSIEEVFFMLDPDEYAGMKRQVGDRIINAIDPEVYSRLAQQILEMGCKIVTLKTAHRGLYAFTGSRETLKKINSPPDNINNWSDREVWCPAFRMDKIISASGSGDASIAGFLAGYLKGQSIEKTLKYANCVGFQNLHALDAVGGIKTWSETTALVDKERPAMIALPLEHTPWMWDEKQEVWIGPDDKYYK